ncbi:MAG TPA: hypothetical protein VF573_11840 [Paraburkholderia sp.]|uniref:hypothetical protein n=1 Tax=Paraburkholderia sp. TaxID=1926495 RepID=UPI002ED4FFE4
MAAGFRLILQRILTILCMPFDDRASGDIRKDKAFRAGGIVARKIDHGQTGK